MDIVKRDHIRRLEQGADGIRHLVEKEDREKAEKEALIAEVSRLGRINRKKAIEEANGVSEPETMNDGGNDPLGFDSGEQFSDAQLREAIKEATGKAPGGRASRETLIATFNELNANG